MEKDHAFRSAVLFLSVQHHAYGVLNLIGVDGAEIQH